MRDQIAAGYRLERAREGCWSSRTLKCERGMDHVGLQGDKKRLGIVGKLLDCWVHVSETFISVFISVSPEPHTVPGMK